MSREATVRASLNIKSGNLDYRSNPTTFVADVANPKPATPGRVIATPGGTNIDLSLLTAPGLAWWQNLDPTNYVTLGIFDPTTNDFYPLAEALPGECYPLRLSRSILQEFSGTGTVGGTATTLRVKSSGSANCEVQFDAFER